MIKVGIHNCRCKSTQIFFMFKLQTSSNHVSQFVLLAPTARCVLKCAISVPTTPPATPVMVTVNVCLAGLQLTAPNVRATLFGNFYFWRKCNCVLCVDPTCVVCLPACSPGRFGPFCTQTCSCPANLACDRFTGDCVCDSGGGDCVRGADVPIPFEVLVLMCPCCITELENESRLIFLLCSIP